MLYWYPKKLCRYDCNQKGEVLPTHNTIEPLTPNLILIYPNAYRPPSFSTLVLSTDSHICTLRVINTQHTTTEQTFQDSISCLPSLTHTDTSRKAFSYCIVDYLHSESTSSLLIQVTKLQTFQSLSKFSISPNFCSKRTWLKLPGAADNVRHSAKITQLQIFHHRYVHQNSAFLPSTDPSISSQLSSESSSNYLIFFL
jgi:hypothetical protein